VKTKHKVWGYVFLVVSLILVFGSTLFLPILKNFTSPTVVRDYLLAAGNTGYVILAFLLLVSTLSPLPNTPIALGGGYVYGIWIGTILALIATIIGGVVYFNLARRFGMPLILKLVNKHHIAHFNHIFKKRGIGAVFISFAFPIFPSTTLCLLLGITNMKLHTFVWLAILGHIPRYLLLNSLGNDLYTGFGLQTIFILIGSIFFALIATFREKVKKIVFKELQELEDSVEEIEKELETVDTLPQKTVKKRKKKKK
jgi:uncharacterized membrane protein YdjX (TVP38/TMEM64 family)